MPDQIPKEVVQERYERLIALQDEISWNDSKALVGRQVQVLVSSRDGKKDGATGRVTGRARDGRLVHVAAQGVEPGDIVTTEITYAAPYHLVADAGVSAVRRWPGERAAGLHPPAGRTLLPLA